MVVPWWCLELCRISPGRGDAEVVGRGLLPGSRMKDRIGDQRGGVNESRWKFFLKRTRPISQSQLRGSHTNKRNHTQTTLETLGTKLEKLGSKAEARWKQPRTKRSKTEHCNSLLEYTTKRSELPNQARAPPEDTVGTFGKI
jgi:hypothetical protein